MPTSDYAPTTAEVGAVLRARVKDSFGNQLSDFTTDTTPTQADVTAFIADAIDEMSEAMGADASEDLWPAIKRAVVWYVAATIEMSYSPEQSAQQNSMYDKLMVRYTAQLTKLQDSETEENEELQDESFEVNESGGSTQAFGWGSVSW